MIRHDDVGYHPNPGKMQRHFPQASIRHTADGREVHAFIDYPPNR